MKCVQGAPSAFRIGSAIQVPRGHFVVVAIRYPVSASFTVRVQSAWWGSDLYDPLSMAESLDIVLTDTEDIAHPDTFDCSAGSWYDFCTNTGGVGPAWYFDSSTGHLYFRVVQFACYNKNQANNCFNGYYEFEGQRIPDIWTGMSCTLVLYTRIQYILLRVKQIMTGWYYDVSVDTCSGCTVSTSYSGVDYYEVTDDNVEWQWDADDSTDDGDGNTGAATRYCCGFLSFLLSLSLFAIY